jgi:mannose-6-phosphate isomerase-like protein (cupin superfamily)
MMAVMTEDPRMSCDRVLTELRAFYAGHAESDGEGTADAAEVAAALAGPLDWASPGEAESFAATRHFLPALRRAAKGPMAGLAEALRAAAPHFAWMQNAGYRREMPREFLDNYATLRLVGPEGRYLSDRVRVGLVLFGPDLFYPAHHHPARELYCVIDGTAEWWRAGEAPALRAPGSVLLHTENQDHVMTMRGDGLLALWAWTGDIESPAVLTRAAETPA